MKLFNRFPFVMQRDSTHCGIACLKMLCKFYGYDVPYNIILEYCAPNIMGTSLRHVKKAAEHLGFETKPLILSAEDLREINKVCILFWNNKHFVVLYKITKDYFYIADPGKGKTRYKHREFLKHWNVEDNKNSGYALFVEPTDAFYKLAQKYKEPKTFIIKKYIVENVKTLVCVVLTLFISGSLLLIFPYLTQKIVDIGISKRNINFILLVLLGQFFMMLGKISFDFIRKWLLLKMSMRINISLVSTFLIKLVRLPMRFVETKNIGDLLQRLSDHSRVNNFLTTQFPNIIYSLVVLIAFSLALLIYDVFIFLVFVIFSLLYLSWMIIFLKRRKLIDYEYFDKQSENNSKTYQYISNLQEIKLQNCETRRCAEWENTQKQMFTVQFKSLKLQQLQEIGCILLNEIKNISITAYVAYAVINEDATLGGMMAIQYIIGQLNGPIEQILGLIYSVQDVKIGINRINEVRNITSEKDIYGTLKSFSSSKIDIVVSNLDFSYDKFCNENVLNNINIKISSGQVTAIVGTSGSGKTTLLKMLLGFYNPTKGNIYIGPVDIRQYNIQWWRKQCGVVMQDGTIFSDTIARNISIENDKIDYSQLEIAMRISNSLDFINALPLGCNTVIGPDGIALSKGQIQRILIARAVYKNPEFLFFDEATNSLDTKNEYDIVSKLTDFFKNKTVVVIAHRLSTIKSANQIIVMDKGQIVETGKHEDLINKKGHYYELVKKQLEVY